MRISAIGLALALLCLPLAAKAAGGQDLSAEEIVSLNADCLDCHADMDEDEAQYIFPSGKVLDFRIDPETQGASAHGKILACVSCHKAYDDDHPEFEEPAEAQYAQSKSDLCMSCHEDVIRQHPVDEAGSPLCTDCHSAHRDPSFKASPASLIDRCGRCHEEEISDFKAGGHAEAVSETSPNSDLPQCNTCHPAHEKPEGAALPMNTRVTQLCIECHSSNLLVLKYKRPGTIVTSYMQDFHGLTFQHLSTDLDESERTQIMTCSTCHGPHNVRPLEQGQLAQVCAKCHEGASDSFSSAWIGHGDAGPQSAILVWIVRMSYRVLIPLVVIGLLLNILIQINHHRKRGRKHAGDEATEGHALQGSDGLPASVIRFSTFVRAEHVVVASLFSMLVLTGLPQAYPESRIAGAFVDFWGGISSTRFIHRACGFTFVTALVIHVLQGIITTVRHQSKPDILPTVDDFKDALDNLKHFMGKGPAPRFGKFDYGEKFEYWGLLLGGFLVGGTGLLLVFPEFVGTYLPGVVLTAARLAHGYEATLAILVLLVWHLWGVSLRPEVFPCDTSIFTGKISTERLREEHALEYERLLAEQKQTATTALDKASAAGSRSA